MAGNAAARVNVRLRIDKKTVNLLALEYSPPTMDGQRISFGRVKGALTISGTSVGDSDAPVPSALTLTAFGRAPITLENFTAIGQTPMETAKALQSKLPVGYSMRVLKGGPANETSTEPVELMLEYEPPWLQLVR
jgi:hypothetical protein